MNTISNTEDMIDSRDVIERIAELEDERDSFLEDHGCPESERGNTDNVGWNDWTETDDAQELENLLHLQDDLEGYCDDWKYGVAIIRDTYFEDYAKELCKDIGDLPSNLPWYIENHIDWAGVADELKVDYTSAEFVGVTYWAR